jgi:hypothetical protein
MKSVFLKNDIIYAEAEYMQKWVTDEESAIIKIFDDHSCTPATQFKLFDCRISFMLKLSSLFSFCMSLQLAGTDNTLVAPGIVDKRDSGRGRC